MADLTADHIAAGTVIGDTYEITRLIGRGGTSMVWAARHRRLPEKEVAIKVLLFDIDQHAEAYARLRHEAEIISRLNHPNIVQILDFDQLPGSTPYMVLELLQGETLRERLRHVRLPVETALEIATQIGSALSGAHHLGVIHRDLKPGNVFLCPTTPPSGVRNHVKVLDFGLSRVQGAMTLSTMSGLGGTPQYMAPEQLTGNVALDARADIFAFGAVLYELLSGRPAFKGDSVPAVAMQVAYRAPEPLGQLMTDLPATLVDTVERALEKDRDRRFPSVTALLAALTDGTQTVRGPAWRNDRRKAPRTRRLWWAIAAASLVALAGVLLLNNPRNDAIRRFASHDAIAPINHPASADAIAVMEFENQQNDSQNDWYRKALQTAVNTELSKIPQVAVVAPEEIRRKAVEVGLDPMAAARRLGVRRFITGSFAVVGNAIRIDARIVDTTNGLQEAAENVQGDQDQFFSLQKEIALAMLEHFQVRLTEAQSASLVKTSNARVDKYRMLLEAEGVTTRPAAAEPPPGPQSRTDAVLREGPVRPSWLLRLLVRAAYAQEPNLAAENVARRILDEYRQAHEQGNLDRLAALYVAFPDSQRGAVAEYAKNVSDLHVELSNVQIQPRDREIAVSYTRRDTFTDKDTGEPMSLEVRLTRFLVQDGGEWKFAPED